MGIIRSSVAKTDMENFIANPTEIFEDANPEIRLNLKTSNSLVLHPGKY